MISDYSTIADAKRFLASEVVSGTLCPCCGRHVEARKRYLNAPMAKVLLLLEKCVRRGDETYVHVPTMLADAYEISPEERASIRGDWAKLVHFGLIDKAPPKGKRKRAGCWRISHAGRQFVAGKLRVRAYFWMFNRKAVVVDDGSTATVSIDEAIGDAFDMQALLEA